MRKRSDETKDLYEWHTGEAILWFMNDEKLYTKGIACKRHTSLRSTYKAYGKQRAFNMKYVEWKEVWETLKS